jgi:4-amino-4-deoxy-L-arabinose transferase-like glycosyltransferase
VTEAPPPAPPSRPREALLVFVAAFACLAAFAGVRDLWDPDEGRYASVALDMVRSGDFVTPREAGMRFVDKPPLLYWAQDAAFAVLGPTPFAARLPCLLAGAAACTLLFALARRWTSDRRAAWLAAGTFATSVAGMGFSRNVSTDMPLVAAVLGAIVAADAALRSPRVAPRAGLGLAVGLGLLAKGALAAALPALVALAWIVVGASPRRVARVAFSPTAWAVALVVAAPWYVAMERANPGWLRHFVVYEHWRRLTDSGYRETHPFWLYVPLLPVALFPWPHLLWRARVRDPVDVGGGEPVPAERLAWAWFVACLLFFSASGTRVVTYVLPMTPPLFLLAGARLSAWLSRGPAAARAVSWWTAAAGLAPALPGAAIVTGLAQRLHAFGEPRLEALGAPLLLASVPVLTAPLFVRLLSTTRARAAALVLAAAGTMWGLDLAASSVDSLRSSRRLAEVLQSEAGRDDVVVVLDRYPQGLRFYAPIDAKIAENPRPGGRPHTQREIVEPYATLDGDGRLLSMAVLRDLWASPSRVLLVARAVDARTEFPDGRVLAEALSGAQRTDLVVVENRPRAASGP